MKKEQIKNILEQIQSNNLRQELLSKIIEKYPDITIKECIDLGFYYEEIILG